MNNHAQTFIYPPDNNKKHRLANRIFKGLNETTHEQCECCGKRIGDEKVDTTCCVDPDQLSFLGPGVPLFFLYLKNIILLLLLMAVLFMSFSIYSNIASADCQVFSKCIPDIFNILAIVNKGSRILYLTIQSYLSLLFVIISIVFFHYFRYKARALEQQCDEVIDSPSDYAIILRRLPLNITQLDIAKFIEDRKQRLTDKEMVETENLKVNKIILSYSLRDYTQVKEENVEEFKKLIKEDKYKEFKPKDLPPLTETSRIAVVIFEKQPTKNLFIYKPNAFQKIPQFFCSPCIPLSNFQVKGQKISIQRAPEPDDICWQNSGITMKGAVGRKMLFSSIAIFILLLGGGTLFGLELLYNHTTDSTLKSILSIGNSLIVTVFNAIIMISLVLTTQKQRNETLTEYQTVLMVKVTIFQFCNAGIFVIAAQVAANYKAFSLNDGICSQITMIMIINAIVPNLTLFLLNYTEIIKKLMRFLVEKNILTATQEELNELYIGPVIDFPAKYAYILKTLWLTALYAPLVPIVVVVSMLGIIINYFFEKILFTKSYSIPNTVSSMVFESAVQLLQYFLITFSLGQLIVYFYIYHYDIEAIPIEWSISIFATIVLSILNSALPMEVINESLFSIKESSHSGVSYSTVENRFEVTYEMLNPAYKTTRQRRNKDTFGLGEKDKEVAVEMTNMFDLAVTENAKKMNRQPLLSKAFQSVKNTNNIENQYRSIKKNELNMMFKQTGPISRVEQPQKNEPVNNNPIKMEENVEQKYIQRNENEKNEGKALLKGIKQTNKNDTGTKTEHVEAQIQHQGFGNHFEESNQTPKQEKQKRVWKKQQKQTIKSMQKTQDTQQRKLLQPKKRVFNSQSTNPIKRFDKQSIPLTNPHGQGQNHSNLNQTTNNPQIPPSISNPPMQNQQNPFVSSSTAPKNVQETNSFIKNAQKPPSSYSNFAKPETFSAYNPSFSKSRFPSSAAPQFTQQSNPSNTINVPFNPDDRPLPLPSNKQSFPYTQRAYTLISPDFNQPVDLSAKQQAISPIPQTHTKPSVQYEDPIMQEKSTYNPFGSSQLQWNSLQNSSALSQRSFLDKDKIKKVMGSPFSKMYGRTNTIHESDEKGSPPKRSRFQKFKR